MKDSLEWICVLHIGINDDYVSRGLAAAVRIDDCIRKIGAGYLRAGRADAFYQSDAWRRCRIDRCQIVG